MVLVGILLACNENSRVFLHLHLNELINSLISAGNKPMRPTAIHGQFISNFNAFLVLFLGFNKPTFPNKPSNSYQEPHLAKHRLPTLFISAKNGALCLSFCEKEFYII